VDKIIKLTNMNIIYRFGWSRTGFPSFISGSSGGTTVLGLKRGSMKFFWTNAIEDNAKLAIVPMYHGDLGILTQREWKSD
jgi:hypothetical protein